MTDKDYMGKDKVMHLGVCLVLALVHPCLAIGAALGKEYGDYKAKGNHWCWWDLLADGIGTLIGGIVWYYLWYVIFGNMY